MTYRFHIKELFGTLGTLKMKGILLIAFCVIQTMVFGHDYFFAFAEVEYDDITQQFESTLVISSHDLEKVLREKNVSIDSIPGMDENSQLYKELQSIISAHFHISSGEQNSSFKIVGAELLFSGVVEIYMESTPIALEASLEISFDLLMQKYPEQQNKLTLYYRSQSYTATFMRDHKTQQILLENS
ncbi:MAG: hypothetical protein ACI837_001942 [Crocinitomicaceae bacterium]